MTDPISALAERRRSCPRVHWLDLRTIYPVDNGPAHRKSDNEDVDENNDGPLPGGSGRCTARIEGTDSQHGARDDKSTTDH